MNLIKGSAFGKYSVLEFLGAGAFGKVYLTHDNLLNRDVALKFVENQDPNAFVAHSKRRFFINAGTTRRWR